MIPCENKPSNEAYIEPVMARTSEVPRGRSKQNDYARRLNSSRSVGKRKAFDTLKFAL